MTPDEQLRRLAAAFSAEASHNDALQAERLDQAQQIARLTVELDRLREAAERVLLHDNGVNIYSSIPALRAALDGTMQTQERDYDRGVAQERARVEVIMRRLSLQARDKRISLGKAHDFVGAGVWHAKTNALQAALVELGFLAPREDYGPAEPEGEGP